MYIIALKLNRNGICIENLPNAGVQFFFVNNEKVVSSFDGLLKIKVFFSCLILRPIAKRGLRGIISSLIAHNIYLVTTIMTASWDEGTHCHIIPDPNNRHCLNLGVSFHHISKNNSEQAQALVC